MISIIVCSVNEELFDKCVKSIEETVTVPYEIIKVDNKEKNYGLSHVYNVYSEKAKYDFVIFIHEDVEFLEKGWDKKIVSLFSVSSAP